MNANLKYALIIILLIVCVVGAILADRQIRVSREAIKSRKMEAERLANEAQGTFSMSSDSPEPGEPIIRMIVKCTLLLFRSQQAESRKNLNTIPVQLGT